VDVTARRISNRVAGAAVGVAFIAALLGLPAGTAGVVRSSVDAVASVAQATVGDAAVTTKSRTWAKRGDATRTWAAVDQGGGGDTRTWATRTWERAVAPSRL
jgi:hypothetical protein